MKSVKPWSSNGNTIAPEGQACQSRENKRLDILEEQLDLLQQDFGVLQSQVSNFGSSFNTASASITKLTSREITSDKATLDNIFCKKLTNSEVKQLHNDKDFTTNIEIGSFIGNADLNIILKKNDLMQYIKLSLSNNIIISQSSGDEILTSLTISKSGNKYYISSENTEAIKVFVYSDAEDFTLWAETPAAVEDEKTLTIGNKINISGDVTFSNSTSWTFDDVEVDNLNIIESLSLNDVYKVSLNTPGITRTGYTKIASKNSIVSMNKGDIIIVFDNNKVTYANLKNGYILSETDDKYYIHRENEAEEYTLSVDAFITTDDSTLSLEAVAEVLISLVTLANNGKYISTINIGSVTVLQDFNIENLNATNITSNKIENEGSISTDSLSANDISAATETVSDLLKAKRIGFTSTFNLPEIMPVDESLIRIVFGSGVIILKIVDAIGDTIGSFTAIKDSVAKSNIIISYSQKEAGIFKSFGIDEDKNLVFKTNLSKNLVYYGSVSTSGEEPIVNTVSNPAEVLPCETPITKQTHTVILGDGSPYYGLEIDGQIKAECMVLPGTVSYENLEIVENLTVGQTANIEMLKVNSTSDLAGDTTIGTPTNNADLIVNGTATISGNTAIGTDEANANLDVNGNTDISGTLNADGKTTLNNDVSIGDATATTPNELTVNATSKLNGNVYIGSQADPKNLYIEGDIIQSGEPYETHAEKVFTKNNMIITREDATTGLGPGAFTGIEAEKYDGTNNGRLVFDNTGTARVGDVGDEKPLTVRDEINAMTNSHIVGWNNDHIETPDNTHTLLGRVETSNALHDETYNNQVIDWKPNYNKTLDPATDKDKWLCGFDEENSEISSVDKATLKVGDSEKFAGKTYDEAKADILADIPDVPEMSGKAKALWENDTTSWYPAYHTNAVDNPAWLVSWSPDESKLRASAPSSLIVADTNKFGGKTYTEAKTDILSNIANAATFTYNANDKTLNITLPS